MYSKAYDGRPPLHPKLLNPPAQSTSYYSESKVVAEVFWAIAQWASIAPTVEKVQQLPHYP